MQYGIRKKQYKITEKIAHHQQKQIVLSLLNER